MTCLEVVVMGALSGALLVEDVGADIVAVVLLSGAVLAVAVAPDVFR